MTSSRRPPAATERRARHDVPHRASVHHALDLPQPHRPQDLPITRRRVLLLGAASATGTLVGRLARWLDDGTDVPAAASPIGAADGAGLTQDAKRIYLAPDDHTDYMWSADEATYREVFLDVLDYYLDLADATDGDPAPYQSRWNCDGWLWVETYEQERSPAQFARLVERIRDGHISVPLNVLCVCLGGAPAEAVLRGMYYPGRLERRHGLSFPLAYAMENQTHPHGVGSLWAGAGARYSWKGICDCASRVTDAWDREHEVYWWEGTDGSRILMKWNSMLQGNQGMGGYAEARRPSDIVEFVDGDPGFLARYAYRVIGAFGKGWDDLSTTVDEFLDVARQKSNATRQVFVSNETDFFEDLEASHGSELPTMACSFGNEWELLTASMAEVTARLKRSTETLRASEALASIATTAVAGSAPPPDRRADRDRAWRNLGLYWEHCWTGDGAVSRDDRAAWSRRLVDEIEAYVEPSLGDGLAWLAGAIRNPESRPRFFVFNPLGWFRSDVVDVSVERVPAGPFHVVEVPSGRQVPHQLVTSDGHRSLRIADGIPSLGYRVYEVREGAGSALPPGPTADARTGALASPSARVVVAPRGAITSLRHHSTGERQWVGAIDGYRANDLGPGEGDLSIETEGPVSVTLRADADEPVRHTSRITLHGTVDRIEIHNTITQGFGDVQAWRFALDGADPDVWHEEVGAILRARLVPDGHYAARNARYDWLTLNRFVHVLMPAPHGLTISNVDCAFFRLGHSTPERLDTTTPLLHVLAGGQVDGGHLGIHDQGGDSRFTQRFALRGHDLGSGPGRFAPDALRFAMEHQSPLLAAWIDNDGDALLPEHGFTFADTGATGVGAHNPVVLTALKPADDGPEAGLIARFWNLSAEPHVAPLLVPDGRVVSAWRTSHIETRTDRAVVEDGRLADPIGPWQMRTYALDVALDIAEQPAMVFLPHSGAAD